MQPPPSALGQVRGPGKNASAGARSRKKRRTQAAAAGVVKWARHAALPVRVSFVVREHEETRTSMAACRADSIVPTLVVGGRQVSHAAGITPMPYGSPVRDKKWIVDGTGTAPAADVVHLGTAPEGLAGGAAPFEVLACVRVGDASIRRIDMSSPFGYDLWLPTGTQPSMALQEWRRLAAFRSVACGLPVVPNMLLQIRGLAARLVPRLVACSVRSPWAAGGRRLPLGAR